jgi:hypothetical protein
VQIPAHKCLELKEFKYGMEFALLIRSKRTKQDK